MLAEHSQILCHGLQVEIPSVQETLAGELRDSPPNQDLQFLTSFIEDREGTSASRLARCAAIYSCEYCMLFIVAGCLETAIVCTGILVLFLCLFFCLFVVVAIRWLQPERSVDMNSIDIQIPDGEHQLGKDVFVSIVIKDQTGTVVAVPDMQVCLSVHPSIH